MSETASKQNRDGKYDFCKFILIFSVILGHTITALKCGYDKEIGLHVFIRSFDMPMFAFVSGYFLYSSCKKKYWKDNIKAKVLTIFIPILIWTLIFDVVERNLVVFRFWFLWSILGCSVLIILIDSFICNRMCRDIAFIVAIGLFHTILIDPFNIGFLLFPTVLGYLYKENESFFLKNNIFVFCVSLVVFAACLVNWKTEYNVWNLGCCVLQGNYLATISNMILRGIMGLSGSLTMLFLFSRGYNLLKRLSHPYMGGWLQRMLKVGENTMPIYILQSFFVENCGGRVVSAIVSKLGANPFCESEFLLAYIYAPIVTIFSIVFITIVIRYIQKVPCVGTSAFGIK